MSKHEIPDDFDELNTGTYRTGYPHRERRSSGLIAFLLALTIFLGGLASALGLLNIRLLLKLMEDPDANLPVDVLPQTTAPISNDLDSLDLPLPQVPRQEGQELQLQDLHRGDKHLSTASILSSNRHSLVRIHSGDQVGVGVVITSDGFILTNAHLLHQQTRYYVTTSDGTPYRAALVGYDVLTDLAVLYIQGAQLQPAAFGHAGQLLEDQAMASVFDCDPELSLLSGTISQARRSVGKGDYRLQLVQTTIGSCDGPMFNSAGQVIGMNSSQVSSFFDLYIQSGRGYAVPSTTLKEVVDQILAYGRVAGRPTLGIRTQEISQVYQQYWNLPGGLQLLEVVPAAQEQGLRQGDILLALNGQRLTSNEDLYKILFTCRIGEPITAVLFRDGQTITQQLTILDTGA